MEGEEKNSKNTPTNKSKNLNFFSECKKIGIENDSACINQELIYKNSQITLFKLKFDKNKDQSPMKPNTASRNNNSTHSLLSMKDYRKPTLSREKSRNKNLNPKQEYQPKLLKPTSFKAMGDNSAHEPSNRGNLDLKLKNPLGQQRNDNNKGAFSNMNLQNVTTPKHGQNIPTLSSEHEPTPKIQRNLGIINNDGKKSRKISKLRPDPDDDFDLQCNEDLSYHLKKASKSETIIKQKHTDRPMNLSPSIIATKSKTQTIKFLTKAKEKSVVQADPKEAIQKFELQAPQLKAEFDYESMIYLDSRQHFYLVKPDYIEKKQKNFTWVMRAVLVQWIMQVSFEFSLKRETFYIAVNIVDRFLEKEQNLSKSDFQLVGAAAMFIASKLEEFEPKSSFDFVKTANGMYSAKQIKKMQTIVCKALKYQLNPPTLFRWANLLMSQWDNYLKQNQYAQTHPLFDLKDPFYFKQVDEDSYMHYRELVHLLDCSILQIQTYQYNPKLLVCSFMYLLIGRNLNIFNPNQIPAFQNHSHYLIDPENLLNDMFESFLQFTFSIRLRQLLPIVQYCSSFFLLPVNYEEPVIPNLQEAEETMQLEQYCSYQTFDKNLLIVVKKRFRGIYFDR